MGLKLVFVYFIVVVAPTPAHRLILLVVMCAILGCCSVSPWHPCRVLDFNFYRGGLLLAAAWTNVASLVALAVNDTTNWTPLIVLLVGWVVIAIIVRYLMVRARAHLVCAGAALLVRPLHFFAQWLQQQAMHAQTVPDQKSAVDAKSEEASQHPEEPLSAELAAVELSSQLSPPASTENDATSGAPDVLIDSALHIANSGAASLTHSAPVPDTGAAAATAGTDDA